MTPPLRAVAPEPFGCCSAVRVGQALPPANHPPVQGRNFRLPTALLTLLLTSCATHHQSAVDAAGPQAGRIEGLFWLFTYLLTAIFLIVMAMLLGTAGESVPVRDGELCLGTWQRVLFIELDRERDRRWLVQVVGS